MKNLAHAFLLSAADGTPVDIRSGRGPWIFLVAHGADCQRCRDYADELVGARAAIREWGARLAVVLRGPPPAARALHTALEATIEVFADPDGSLDVPPGTLVVTDEWGDVYHSAQADPDHQLPAPAEIAKWVQFVAIQCPECEQPEGEWRNLGIE